MSNLRAPAYQLTSVSADEEVREYAPEARRFGLWVWATTPTHIAFGQPFYAASYQRIELYWVHREVLYAPGDSDSRKPLYSKIGRAVARLFDPTADDERRGLFQLHPGRGQ